MTDIPSPITSSETQKEDFRVRAAREKRQRMRARLLDATLDVYLPGEKGSAAVIDDVVRKADVSRGTFYKYFDSLEEAIDELGKQMANDIILDYQQLFAKVDDELTKLAGGVVTALTRAAMEPRWGAFTSSVDYISHLSARNPLNRVVTEPLLKSRENQLLQFDSVEAAADILVGATVEATKRLSHGQQQNKAYIREVSRLCMMALGAPVPSAIRAVDTAWQQLQQHAEQLSWWQPLQEE